MRARSRASASQLKETSGPAAAPAGASDTLPREYAIAARGYDDVDAAITLINERPGAVLDEMLARVEAGDPISEALRRHSVFPPLLIRMVAMGERSGNLDSAHAKELHQLFFDLRKELGQTFVIVTHNEELAEMADRRLVMKDGVI